MSPLEPEQAIAAPLLGKSDSDGVHAGAGIQVRLLPVATSKTRESQRVTQLAMAEK
jgi:hypothetical protein